MPKWKTILIGFSLSALGVTLTVVLSVGLMNQSLAQTPTPISKRFSYTTVRVSHVPTLVLIDNSAGIACYRIDATDGGPWSCAQMKK